MVASEIARKCLRCELSGEYVVDAHSHMGPWFSFYVRRRGAAEAMLEAMDLCGVTVGIIAPHIGIGPDEKVGNDLAYRMAAKYPDRFVPYVVTNPNRGADGVRAEIARWEPAGIRGLKIHPTVHQYPVTGPNYRPVYEHAAEHGLTVLSHTWEGSPHCATSAFAALAADYPTANFLVGHSASTWGAINQACEAAEKYPNVYLDLCCSNMIYDGLEQIVARIGAERALFGSDNPCLDPRPPLGRVLMSRVSDDDKRLILGLNAKRLFGL